MSDGRVASEAAIDVAERGTAGRCVGAPGAQLVIISGPSGVGKDTIIDALRRNHPREERTFVVTCTTRRMREGEADGQSYHFLSEDAFRALREHGALLEAADVHGNWYGTPRNQVVDALGAGRDAILKIDIQGARAIRAVVPDAVTIFIVPPSLDELYARLLARGKDTPEALERRRRDAQIELDRQHEYDHVVMNETDQVAKTAARIDEIIAMEHAIHPERRVAV